MRFTEHLARLIASREGADDPIWRYATKTGARGLARTLELELPELYAMATLESWPEEPEEWDAIVVKPTSASNSRGVLPLVRKDDGTWRSMFGDGGARPWEGWRKWSALERARHYELGVEPYSDSFLFEELVERRMDSGARLLPYDWKLYAIHGRVAWANQIDKTSSRNSKSYRTAHWWRTDAGLIRGNRIIHQPRQPARLPAPPLDRERELLEAADRMARFLRMETGTPFVRLDFFVEPARVLFGEVTPHPSGGKEVYDDEADRILGNLWSGS